MISAYNDIGDPTYECPYCSALLWFSEKIKSTTASNPEFSICCSRGKVQLPLLREAPRPLNDLLMGRHKDSRNFLEHIRAYNMMYAFTSMGGHLDSTYNKGGGPYSYRLGGQNYHRLGSLLPVEGASPKFSQLYMYCGEDETQDRIDTVR